MKRIFAPLILVLCLAALAGCRTEHQWRQKTTLTVETPSGPRSGSSVVEVTALFGKLPLTGDEVEYSFRGEATVVEIMPGRYLFALLGGSEERFYRAARDRFTGMHRRDWLYEIPKQTEPVALTGKQMPWLVTFDDVRDPKTVRQVDPANLAASFGPGVTLTSITLAITDEPRTSGRLKSVLGWIDQVKFIIPPEQQPRLGSDQTFEQRLMRQDFIDRRSLQEMRD